MTNLQCRRCGREIHAPENTNGYCFDCREIIGLENSIDKTEENDDEDLI